MIHSREGEIQAYLDGELSPEEGARLQDHLDSCARCQGLLREVGDRGEGVSEALAAYDPPPPVSRARTAVLRRIRNSGSSGEGLRDSWGARLLTSSSGFVPLARAAVLVLLLAGGGAAAVVPDSPVRAWIASGWERVASAFTPDPGPAPGLPEPASEAVGEAEETGVRIGPVGSRIRILLSGLEAGSEVRIVLVNRYRGGVYALEGSGFRTGPGRIEASIPRGGVRVEVPRGVREAVVTVDGRIYFQKMGDRLELAGPDPDSTASEIHFRVPGDSGA